MQAALQGPVLHPARLRFGSHAWAPGAASATPLNALLPAAPLPTGCTLTAAVVCGDVLTVASVGDSRAVLDTGAEVVDLTADHRIGENPAEFARLERAGGRLARLNEYGAGPSRGASEGVGPVRLWPGGIMVGRAVGDRDVGAILLAHPHIRQASRQRAGSRSAVGRGGRPSATGGACLPCRRLLQRAPCTQPPTLFHPCRSACPSPAPVS